MAKQVNAGKAFVTFLLGSAVGAGAAFLMSKVCKTKGSMPGAAAEKSNGESGTYCAVPEGADICFPEQ